MSTTDESNGATDRYVVSLSSAAVRSLRAMPPRMAEPLVRFTFEGLAENPRRRGKPLVGDFTGLWSARRGDYRVLYDVDDEARVAAVIRIAHRSEATRPR